MSRALLILSLPALLAAAWVERTAKLDAPKADIGKKTYIQFSPGVKVQVKYKRKTSVLWVIKAEKSGQFKVYAGSRLLKSFELKKGKNKVKVYLEPGTYAFESTVPALARYYVWKRRRWQSIPPQGGGIPLILVNRGRRYTYYKIEQGSPVFVKVKGPTKLHIFYRATMDKKKKARVDLRVSEGERIIVRTAKTLRASKVSFFFDKDTIRASKPLIVEVKVPEGLHVYKIEVLKGKGAVKIYKTKSKAKKKRKKRKNNKTRIGAAPRGFGFHLSVGGFSTSNAYKYSQAYIDTFNLGLKDYRYPGVQSISDVVAFVRARASYRFGPAEPWVGASAYRYRYNSQLNYYVLKAGGKFRAADARGYLSLAYIPKKGVRPTYTAPLTYELLAYSYAKVRGRLSYKLGPIVPEAFVSFGRYDFVSPFDHYDADFWRAGGGVRVRSLGLELAPKLEVGKTIAAPDPNIHKDWSHEIFSIGVEGRLMAWRVVPRLSAKLLKRSYLTSDTLDTHYQRIDAELSVLVGLEVPLPWRLKLYTDYRYLSRATSSPLNSVDVLKDYSDSRFVARLAYSL